MYLYNEIGSRIRKVRNTMGESQRSFARKIYDLDGDEEAIGASASAISRVENGVQLPPCKMLDSLGNPSIVVSTEGGVDAGISADYLLFGRMHPSVEVLVQYPIFTDTTQRKAFFAACEDILANYEPDSATQQDSDLSDSSLRLRQIRREHDCKQGDFNIERRCVSRNECSDLPNTAFLIKFCKRFRVSADYILFGTYPALPKYIQSLLLDFRYGTQQKILKEFCSAAERTWPDARKMTSS